MINIAPLINIGLSFFLLDVNVTDTSYTATSGHDVQAVSKTRTIKAAVDPSNSKRLQNIFGGNVADGSIGIFTSDFLYIDDMYTSGSRSLQSYVEYDGMTYRVMQKGSWTLQAGIRVYLAERHVAQDII